MPELAEVEYFRRRWQPGVGRKVAKVILNPKARVGRGVDAKAMTKALTGAKLLESFAAAKQMAFRFSGDVWIGVHLGMTGRLEAGDDDREPTPYDHFKLTMPGGIPALALGSEKLPLALLSGRVNVPNVQSMDAYKLLPGPGDQSAQARAKQTLREVVALKATEAGGELDFLRRTADVTLTSVDRLGEVAKAYRSGATYPETGLARKLEVVARLIAGDMGTQIFYVSLGGFDTHSRQQPVHELLLAELSGAIAAFLKDLKSHKLADRVMVATFSEFGRRVDENGSLGTDHGAASQMFCIGPGVKPGVTGAHPSLTDLVDGDLKHHTDFRQVYAALLQNWLGYPAEPVLGKGFQPVDCVKM